MPLFSGRYSSKIDSLPTARGAIFLESDQPAPMEHIGKDECRLGAFLEVHLLASRKDGRDPGRSRLVWT
jgi:hypothetical protein